MKTNQIILGLLLLCIMCGCNNSQSQLNQAVNSIKQDSIVNENNSVSPFSESLMNEIQKCIYDTNHLMQSQIYDLWFAKTDGDCCFAISDANFYHSQVAEGFYLIGDKLVVYYGTDGTCSAILEGRIDPFINRENKVECDIARLIDTTLLLKECPAGYPDENSDEALYTTFDPYGKIFKVNGDSLELIYCGCL